MSRDFPMVLKEMSPTARKRLFLILVVVVPVIILFTALSVVSAAIQVHPAADILPTASETVVWLAIASAVTMCATGWAAAYALARTGTAAVSSLVEKPEGFFKAFLVVTLCEAIAIYGLVIAVLLWLRIPA